MLIPLPYPSSLGEAAISVGREPMKTEEMKLFPNALKQE
jgi:hypothetical protein